MLTTAWVQARLVKQAEPPPAHPDLGARGARAHRRRRGRCRSWRDRERSATALDSRRPVRYRLTVSSLPEPVPRRPAVAEAVGPRARLVAATASDWRYRAWRPAGIQGFVTPARELPVPRLGSRSVDPKTGNHADTIQPHSVRATTSAAKHGGRRAEDVARLNCMVRRGGIEVVEEAGQNTVASPQRHWQDGRPSSVSICCRCFCI